MRKFFTYIDPIVPVHHPQVVVTTALEQGAVLQDLFEDSEITPEMLANPETRLSYLQFGVLVRNALRATGNPALGLDVGDNTRFPQMGVLGLAIMSSPTIGAALEIGLRYDQLLAPAFEFALRVEGGTATLSVRETLPGGPHRVFAHEMVLTGFHRQARELIGAPLPLRAVRFAYPEPEHVARYRDFCDAPLVFDQSVTEVDFDAALLNLPVLFAEPATAKLAEKLCAELPSLVGPNEGLLDQVRRLLLAANGQPPNVEALARALQTSSRSLRRALQEMGSSYQELLDESRRVRSVEWVRSTPMTYEQIAGRLGFSNVRSFRRAFKRWTGRTPHEYRADGSGVLSFVAAHAARL
ncbi:MAG TPA: AraC family transcriptional regulator [Polyangiaceae bacterium]|nr:AraC family transcriptional regulator [Polyangiaceae bacterium]